MKKKNTIEDGSETVRENKETTAYNGLGVHRYTAFVNYNIMFCTDTERSCSNRKFYFTTVPQNKKCRQSSPETEELSTFYRSSLGLPTLFCDISNITLAIILLCYTPNRRYSCGDRNVR